MYFFPANSISLFHGQCIFLLPASWYLFTHCPHIVKHFFLKILLQSLRFERGSQRQFGKSLPFEFFGDLYLYQKKNTLLLYNTICRTAMATIDSLQTRLNPPLCAKLNQRVEWVAPNNYEGERLFLIRLIVVMTQG